MSGYVQTNYVIRLPDEKEIDLIESDSGKLLLIDALTDDCKINLPPAKIGLHYKFMAIGTLGEIVTIKPEGTSLMRGSAFNHTVVTVPVFTPVSYNGAADVKMTAAAARGDWCEVTCNGADWIVNGIGAAVSFSLYFIRLKSELNQIRNLFNSGREGKIGAAI